MKKCYKNMLNQPFLVGQQNCSERKQIIRKEKKAFKLRSNKSH